MWFHCSTLYMLVITEEFDASETAQYDNLLISENNMKHSVAPAIRKFKPNDWFIVKYYEY